MAKKEIVNVITIKTEESKNTIKGLREEIKNLKTTLETAEIGSDKFEQATRDLAKAQNDLKTILVDGKKKGDAIEGSYNHLAQTMAELKKEWKATADEAKRNDIGKQIDEINTQLKELDASIGNNQRNVGNYKQDFVDAMTEMVDKTFDFGQELNKVNQKTEVTRNTLDGVGKVASGVASGFAAVQGVTALLGIENKNLEKTLVKVQSAMAIAQGIGGLKGLVEGAGQLVTAFKAAKMGSAALAAQTTTTTVAMGTTATATTVATGALQTFKAALISTGVGALVVALGTLIGYLVTLGDEANDVEEDIDDASRALKDFDDRLNRIKNNDEYIIRLKIAGGADEEEIWQDRIENARKLYNDALHYENILADSLGRQSQAYKDAVVKTKEYDEELKEVKQNYNVWVIEQETKREEEAKAIRDRAHQSTLDTYQEELAALYNKYQEEKQLLINSNLETNSLYEEYLKNKEELKKKYKIEDEFVKPEAQEGIISQLSERYDIETEMFAASRERMATINAETNAKMMEQLNEFAKKETERIREEAEKQKMIKEALYQNSLSIASSTLGSLSSLIGEETAAGKAAAVAQTTIDTYQSAQAAYKSMVGIPVVGPGLAIAAATAAALAGAANVKKILAVNTDGSGGNGSVDTSAPAAAPRLDLSSTMPVQYTRDLLTDSEMSNMNQEQKVYVTETDITNTQNKVKVSESNASF